MCQCRAARELGKCFLKDEPLVQEGVEAGEDEQRHHGTERHHVVKL